MLPEEKLLNIISHGNSGNKLSQFRSVSVVNELNNFKAISVSLFLCCSNLRVFFVCPAKKLLS